MNARKHRGFTLIELFVGMAVGLLVIGVVMGTFLSQQRSLQALDLSRDASAAIRDSMLMLQETVGRAGYGIDPRYAFDLRNYNCTSGGPGCRDKVDGPDELVFVERDPNYYWPGTTASPVQGCDPTAPCTGHAWQLVSYDMTIPKITIAGRVGDQFLKGQVIQLMCAKGVSTPLMGTVATTVAPLASAANVDLTLMATSATNPYQANIPATHDTCYDGAGVSVFLVNRYRFHVATINGDPWLMLDRGLDYNKNTVTPENGADVADEIPIGHGVEDFQVAYLLKPNPAGGTGPDNGGDWIVGDTPGTVEEPDPTTTPPQQSASDSDPSRYANTNPANVRALRISIGVRSLSTDKNQPSPWLGEPMPLFENRNVVLTGSALGRYRRFQSQVVVATPNLNSKDPFVF